MTRPLRLEKAVLSLLAIATFDMPKLAALRRLFPAQWRAQALSY